MTRMPPSSDVEPSLDTTAGRTVSSSGSSNLGGSPSSFTGTLSSSPRNQQVQRARHRKAAAVAAPMPMAMFLAWGLHSIGWVLGMSSSLPGSSPACNSCTVKSALLNQPGKASAMTHRLKVSQLPACALQPSQVPDSSRVNTCA